MCRATFLALRQIASIRPLLSESSPATLVRAFVISRLDFCNSALSGLPMDQIMRLQRVQNSAARLIKRKRKRDHITPVLMELHWLPVHARINYKIATLAFRHFDKSLPQYLSDRLTTYEPSRTLRSTSEKLLKNPRINLKTFGKRSFCYTAPQIWNALPSSLRETSTLPQFKAQLKTHLFKLSYNV